MKLGPRRNYHEGRAALRHYAKPTRLINRFAALEKTPPSYLLTAVPGPAAVVLRVPEAGPPVGVLRVAQGETRLGRDDDLQGQLLVSLAQKLLLFMPSLPE